MLVTDIKGSAGNFVTLSASVDGVRCDVTKERAELVVRPTAWDRQAEVVARGPEVPEVLRVEYARLELEGREWRRSMLEGLEPREPMAFLPGPHFLAKD